MNTAKQNSVRISVGVPAYNQGKYLRQTLVSLLDQTIPADEIVVSNNFSTDETAEVLKEFEGRIRVISPPHHMQMMEHWNFLLPNLQYEWIALLSSDDVANPNFIEHLKRGAMRDPNAVLVRSGWQIIDEDNNIVGTHKLLSVQDIVRWPQTFYESLPSQKASFAAFAAKKEDLLAINGFPDACRLYGDRAAWIKLSTRGTFVHEKGVISQYRAGDRVAQKNKRMQTCLEDEIYIETILIPEIAESAPDIDANRVQAGQHARLRSILAYFANAGADIYPETHDMARPYFMKWAEAIGAKHLIEQYDRGEFRDGALKKVLQKGRTLLRCLYQGIFA